MATDLTRNLSRHLKSGGGSSFIACSSTITKMSIPCPPWGEKLKRGYLGKGKHWIPTFDGHRLPGLYAPRVRSDTVPKHSPHRLSIPRLGTTKKKKQLLRRRGNILLWRSRFDLRIDGLSVYVCMLAKEGHMIWPYLEGDRLIVRVLDCEQLGDFLGEWSCTESRQVSCLSTCSGCHAQFRCVE